MAEYIERESLLEKLAERDLCLCFLARRKPWCSITHQKVSM